jgi:hypothetical protein
VWFLNAIFFLLSFDHCITFDRLKALADGKKKACGGAREQ